jgi:transposase
MITEEKRERIRRAYYLEKKSLRRIAREEDCSRETVKKALANQPTKPSSSPSAKSAPVFQPYQRRVETLLAQNASLPRKQRYTAHRIFEIIRSEGYQGCESRIRQVVGKWRRAHSTPEVFLPLEFEPGQDAQCDWGEAMATLAGRQQTVQVFVMRLCYSRKAFVMAFPSQNQESFFSGHVQAFSHFGGVPARISYDNLATAVKFVQQKAGGGRRQTSAFVALRSHYLFESHFCTPRQAHEKGGVEHEVGLSRRNFLVPIPQAASFEELNRHLLQECLKDDQRRVSRQSSTIGQMWECERPFLEPLPAFEYDCCQITNVRLTPYSQATFETNRYSVPVNRATSTVMVKAYPFHLEILDRGTLLARHPRCYGREQDIFEPLHYLPLLEQRPGAFDYAKPLKQWRRNWPASYHRMLHQLRECWPEGRGVQEFIRILQLHQDHPAALVEQAIEQALSYGCIHLDGVLHCLHHLSSPQRDPTSFDLSSRPDLDALGKQPIDLLRYEQLLKQRW